MIFPNRLKVGDTIGITAVSAGCIGEADVLRLENAKLNLNKEGFVCRETDNVRKINKLVSSEPRERARQFMELIEDEKIKAIIAVTGGEILMEILPYLDFEKIEKSSPKWIQGYSDPSLLNYVITTKTNISTINGVNFKSFGMEPWHKAISKSMEFLRSSDTLIQDSFDLFESERVDSENPYEGFCLNEKVEYRSLYGKENNIKGRIIGGCIDVLSLLPGTKFDSTKSFCSQFNEGMLWYFDNCELNIAGFYRTIWQMKEAGWFNNANGFLIGRTAVKKDMFDFTYEDALHKAFDDMNVPVFYDVDIGHVPPQWTIVNGSLGEFTFNNGQAQLIQKLI